MKRKTTLLIAMFAIMSVTAEDVVLPKNVRAILPEGVKMSVTYLAENVVSRTREAKPMIVSQNHLYFAAVDADNGEELWVSDGTPEGTHIVADINSGVEGSNPCWLTSSGDKVFFSANDGVHGDELWVTDGTTEGTHLVYDIYEGAIASAPQAITAFGNKVLFFAMDEESEWDPVRKDGDEKWLWISDGTQEGTERIGDTPTKLDFDGTRGCIVIVNGKGVFPGFSKEYNETIWVTDGTAEGTKPLLNINPRTATDGVFDTEASSIDHLVAVDGRIAAFRATAVKEVVGGDIDWGVEMWITDGTTEGTKQIGFPINKLEKDGQYASCDFRQTYPIGDHLYFRANNGNKAVNGAEPWVWYIDQKIEEGVNPRMIQDCAHIKNVMYYNCHPSCFYEYKDYMYMAGNFTYDVDEKNEETGEIEHKQWDSSYHNLCRGKISEIEAGPDEYEKPIEGEYLWTGFSIYPSKQPFVHKFCTVNDTLFFVCRDDDTNYELWKLDSREPGSAEFDKPVKVLDLPGDGQICYTTNLKEQLYFVSATQNQLYQYEMYDVVIPEGVTNLTIAEVQIMPNPVYDILMVKAEGVSQINLTDLMGKTLKSTNGNEMNVADIPEGVYLVNVYHKGGNTVEKVIIR
ncbi:MAG: T9SS type A sorting domain-containing protein [Paludibacteraceae bacterium]|nr:T9SS type A sorting domain-containing protein [Paludibacteraceae bacterium]